MKALRKLIGSIFAFEAVCFLFACFTFLTNYLKYYKADSEAGASIDARTGILGGLLSFVFFVAAPATLGIAAWTIQRKSRKGWAWGLAASIINIALAFPVFLKIDSGPMQQIYYGFGVVGMCGVILFLLPYSSPAQVEEKSISTKISGDGTNPILNRLVWVISGVLSLVASQAWWHWAGTQMLDVNYGIVPILMVLPLLAISVIVHELGHAWAAWGLGMKICSVTLGPFDWRITEGKWKFTASAESLGAIGGAIGVVSTRFDEPSWYRIYVASAGPAASLLFGMVAFALAITAKGSSYEHFWGYLADLASFGAVFFVLNLIPLRVLGAYTDGARIYQILSGNAWANYHHAFAMISSTLVTPLRPRDYDLTIIERAANGVAMPLNVVYLWLNAYSHSLDRSNYSRAAEFLEKAETVYLEFSPPIPAELHTVFVFGHAYLTQDAIRARTWWERMEAKNPTRFNGDYWMAHSALHWIEGNLDAANESWEKGDALARKLPSFGAYEFDRYCFSLLRRALDESAIFAEPDPAQTALSEAI